MARPAPHPGGGKATSPATTEFGFDFDFGVEGDGLTYDGWSPPDVTSDPNAAANIFDDRVGAAPPAADVSGSSNFATAMSSDGSGRFAVGQGQGSHVQTTIPFGIAVVSRPPGITATQPAEIGFAGLAKAAGIVTHVDSLFDAVTASLPDLWERLDPGRAGGSVTQTAVLSTDPTPADKPARTPNAAEDSAALRTDTATESASASMAAASSATPTVFETRVAAGADDAEERGTGSTSLTSSDLELTFDGTLQQTVGIRFTGIDIPRGAIITGAYIQFTVDQVSTGASSLLIRGQNGNDAAAFADVKFNVSSRPTTDASAAWSPADWTIRGEAGLAERTTDLAAIVQEIVDRQGWAALNDMAFLITGAGTRTARSYEGRAAAAPLLHIEYLPPGAASDPVVFNNPPDANPATNQIAELAGAGTAIGITASASDPDAGSTVTYSINDTRFAIDANTGIITRSANGTLDFETQASINLTVTATSSDTSTAAQAFTLAVTNTPESVAFNTPPDADTATNQIAEDAATGTAVGITASARDPDAGSTVAYSISDTRFAVSNSGVVTRSGTGTLDAQTQPSVTFTVTATSSDGSTATQIFSVGVTAASSGAPTIFEKRVAAGADDAEERGTGSMTLTSSDLELTFDGTMQQTVGIRFTGIDIPQGAVITNAYIQFRADEVNTGSASLLIRGQDTDDATAFADINFNVSSRPTTNASTAWAPAGWTTKGQAGPAQQTTDLTAIVQEIVDRQGWAALNDMAFLVSGTGTRAAESFEGSAAAAPLLHIEYLPPGPASDPVAFNNPPDANPATNQIAELAGAGTAIGITASASDPDAGSTVTYSITDTRFAIDASTGVITRSGTGTLDFETGTSVTITVTANSSDRSADAQTFIVGILDSSEPLIFNTPPDANTAANRIDEDAAAGTAVGITASASDPDAGSSVTYTVDDQRFAIDPNTGVVTRSGTGTLDAQTQPSVTVTVTATSSDGSTAGQAFAVNIVPDAPQVLFRFAAFGDYGDSDLSGEFAVAALVDSWNVDFVLTVGDNAYGSLTFDNAVGQFYSDYIGNYQGSYGDGSTINRFFPVLGNHEYENNYFNTYLSYFSLPDNERYYDFQIGSVHFFALNSNKQEPDGRSASSVQAQWLATGLAASDAMFDVAYFHHTPYTPGGGTSSMRWSFESWGVDAVFAGHEHEYFRVMRDDNQDGVAIPYVTTGLGGAGNRPPDVGANLVTVTDTGMLIEFYTVDGVLQDSYFIEAPAAGSPLFVNGNDVLNGTANADYLWGLRGNDTLTGGRGNDMLIGDEGNDLFVFRVGDGHDVVADFSPGSGVGDVLDLRAFAIDNRQEFLQVATNQGANVVVELNGDRISLFGVQTAQFNDNDFKSDLIV